jgi:hypothetical protein
LHPDQPRAQAVICRINLARVRCACAR